MHEPFILTVLTSGNIPIRVAVSKTRWALSLFAELDGNFVETWVVSYRRRGGTKYGKNMEKDI